MKQVAPPSEDTIAAISTPEGKGGIAIIRISGGEASKALERFFKRTDESKSVFDMDSHRLYRGQIFDPFTDRFIDNVLCVLMKSPHSYTGEDVVEIQSHGGYLVPRRILDTVFKNGVRPATPGEFTLRAFMNGKMDLAQAEAVVDVINAQTDESLRQAEFQLEGVLSKKINELRESILDSLAEIEAHVDFPEDEIDPIIKEHMSGRIEIVIDELKKILNTYEEGRIIKNGVYTAILGKPNVGKSSLLNRLLMKDRAIVSPFPGTTRDFIEESIVVKGIPLMLVDTAGLRASADEIESIGIQHTKKKAIEAEFIIAVFDGSMELDQDDLEIISDLRVDRSVLVINKIDMPQNLSEQQIQEYLPNQEIVRTSAKEGIGIDDLKATILQKLVGRRDKIEASEFVISELRHKIAIEKATEGLYSFKEALSKGDSPEFLAVDLRYALDSLGDITGEVTTEDVLGRIFSKFCIGK
ncbi:MAG: tRNA uridine-5-carboxymethylaminomethyl(34) synthesis GTPase MnmE [Thermodesulfobacteriota bacterium]